MGEGDAGDNPSMRHLEVETHDLEPLRRLLDAAGVALRRSIHMTLRTGGEDEGYELLVDGRRIGRLSVVYIDSHFRALKDRESIEKGLSRRYWQVVVGGRQAPPFADHGVCRHRQSGGAGGVARVGAPSRPRAIARYVLTYSALLVMMSVMPSPLTEDETAARRARVLQAARWCFLNFGFAKTSFEDIAKRAHLSRTLLYRMFADKEDVFSAVFAHWLVARHPEAKQAATGPGRPLDRILTVCRVMVVEPWSDMVGTPMGGEFHDVCDRIDPEIEALHRKVALQCVGAILQDEQSAEVFLLALDGLLADVPAVPVLEQRIRVLADRFVQPRRRKADRP